MNIDEGDTMKNKLQELTVSLLEEIGEDPSREGLLKTPKRVAKAWKFFTKGYHENLEDIYKTINHEVLHYCIEGTNISIDELQEEKLIFNIQWADYSIA